jgi:hypothetical protein
MESIAFPAFPVGEGRIVMLSSVKFTMFLVLVFVIGSSTLQGGEPGKQQQSIAKLLSVLSAGPAVAQDKGDEQHRCTYLQGRSKTFSRYAAPVRGST